MAAMLNTCRKLVPAVSACGRALSNKPLHTRNFWDLTRPSLIMRDMERQMENLEKDMLSSFPFRRMPRFIPMIQGSESGDSCFRFNVDVEGFKPEEIQVTLNDRVLTLKAKMERKTDGGHLQQEFTRQITVPQNVNLAEMKTFLRGGILTVEAPCEPETAPREIPISRDGGETQKVTDK